MLFWSNRVVGHREYGSLLTVVIARGGFGCVLGKRKTRHGRLGSIVATVVDGRNGAASFRGGSAKARRKESHRSIGIFLEVVHDIAVQVRLFLKTSYVVKACAGSLGRVPV